MSELNEKNAIRQLGLLELSAQAEKSSPVHEVSLETSPAVAEAGDEGKPEEKKRRPVVVRSGRAATEKAEGASAAPRKRALAPMLQQYLDIKEQYVEHLLLFQVGDFYEVFFDDAVTAAQVLNIRLTSRDKNDPDPIPMCGVPIHALDNYIPKLVAEGYSCVVVSQVEDAKGKKGMVRREVTRIVTPGVRYEGDGLDEKRFNYLGALCLAPSGVGAMSYVDVSTGDLRVRQTETLDELLEVCRRVQPSELILPSTLFSNPVGAGTWVREFRRMAGELHIKVIVRPFEQISAQELSERLQEYFRGAGGEPSVDEVTAIERGTTDLLDVARAAVLTVTQYVEEVTFGSSPRFAEFRVEQQESSVFIDASTRRNLELTEARIDGDRRHSLLAHIDYCRTAMGSRLLSDWILGPSTVRDEIVARHDAVQELLDNPQAHEDLRSQLASVRDLDRIISRITGLRATPRDLGMLRDSICEFPVLRNTLESFQAPLLQALAGRFDDLEDIAMRLSDALVEEPPMKVSEGGIFKDGFHAEIDRLRSIRTDGRSNLAELEAREKERTGISGLKVRYNNVFGYFIEVSKAHLTKVPSDYERRQTLTNAERFITPALKEYEVSILSARGKQIDLERELFVELRNFLGEQAFRIQAASRVLSQVDALCSLATLAARHHFTRPVFSTASALRIVGGRHPVVEQVIGRHNFVANDVLLDAEQRRFAVLTGPNMGGKSTYLRQIGLIQLLAQAGSFVPAEQAELPIVDRIFTRIGASDDLSRGDSTFMVEMREASVIVRRSTARSLVLIDEIGRGTATADGLALATAISEWLHDNIGCLTVFATHFHELTALPEKKKGAFCLSVGVIEKEREIIFTHRIEERAADRSYGIEVARLAGLPERLLGRAEELLITLAEVQPSNGTREGAPVRELENEPIEDTFSFFKPLADRLRTLNPDAMTPLQALNELALLRRMLED